MSAASEVQFLRNIQRLLDEGDFVATYKFALLQSLADLSVEGADNDQGALVVPLERIAEKFIEYYWPQVIPFRPVGGADGILQQNTGQQASILKELLQPRNWPKTSPKRVVWYVSKTNSFRACSRILEVQIGPASAIFKRYERLGIYEWRDLMGITKQKRHGEVMAIHFADTEVFETPVTLSETRNFKDTKILVGAHSISEESFLRIYKSGMARFSSP